MKKNIKESLLLLAALWASPLAAQAQTHEAHTGFSNHAEANPVGMRDPDAYSEGFKRNQGVYALDPRYRLRMGDEDLFASLRFDRLEYVRAGGRGWGAYDGQAWFGTSYDRLVLKGEGEIADGRLRESRSEVLWGHAVSAFWDLQLGARFDYGRGEPSRQWLAVGAQGLAPYWFDVDATAYLGTGGRSALRLNASYDFLLSQRLYLQPGVEVNFYMKDDPDRGIGPGLSDGKVGLRLKYEISRQLTPYVGVEWSGKFGKTATYARDAGASRQETRFVAGLSFWF